MFNPWFHAHRCLSPPFHTLRPPFLVKSQRLADHLVSGCRSYSFVPLRSDLHWQHLGVQGTIEAGCRDFRLDTSPLSWTGGVGRRGEGTPPPPAKGVWSGPTDRGVLKAPKKSSTFSFWRFMPKIFGKFGLFFCPRSSRNGNLG